MEPDSGGTMGLESGGTGPRDRAESSASGSRIIASRWFPRQPDARPHGPSPRTTTQLYAADVVARLAAAGLRAEADLRNEKIGYKVREHSVAKVPVILAVGAREAESEAVAMRRLGQKQQEVLALDEAVDRLRIEAAGPLAQGI